MNQIEYLKSIHFKCREYLDNVDYLGLANYLKTFDRDDVDINELKMIQISTNYPFLLPTPVHPVKERLQARFNALK